MEKGVQVLVEIKDSQELHPDEGRGAREELCGRRPEEVSTGAELAKVKTERTEAEHPERVGLALVVSCEVRNSVREGETEQGAGGNKRQRTAKERGKKTAH